MKTSATVTQNETPHATSPAAEDGQALHVDAVLIGTGQAVPPLATALAARGERVAVFEGGDVGGSCVNVGCTPTKTLRKSARVAHMARRAGEFGVEVGHVRVDFAAAMERTARMVDASRNGLTKWITGTKGVTLIREWAELAGRDGDRFVVRGSTTTVLASRVYINTGTRPAAPPIPGLDDFPYLTNETVLKLRERPEHLLLIGASYIGLELGQIFRRLGSEVTIIEAESAVAAREDADVSQRIAEMLESEGITLLTNAKVTSVSETTDKETGVGVSLQLEDGNSGVTRTLGGSHLLVATGRKPNTERLGLESVGVEVDDRGFIPVNGHLECTVPGIWALGDVNGRGAFTHTSYQDHEIVLANHTGGSRTADGRVMTYAMFTDPPLGRVGIGEQEARALMAEGRRFLSVTHEMSKVSRAKEESETVGVMKVLVDAESKLFVGASLLGINADEIVQVIGAMIAAQAPYTVLKEALPIHPTVTEFFPTILGKLRPLT
ncbi:MAG: mercuric reductase [Gemmatimonadaceae bacterium]